MDGKKGQGKPGGSASLLYREEARPQGHSDHIHLIITIIRSEKIAPPLGIYLSRKKKGKTYNSKEGKKISQRI